MLDPMEAEYAADPVVQLYRQAEVYLLTRIAESAKRMSDAPDWMQAQLLEIQRLRRASEVAAGYITTNLSEAVEDAVQRAHNAGVVQGINDVQPLMGVGAQVSAYGTVEHAAVASLAASTTREMGKAQLGVLRAADDAWRRITQQVTARTVTGAQTVQGAWRDATKQMAREGLTAFVDKAGKRWKLDTYAEMAVRQATNQALMDGHTQVMAENGFDLVRVSSHPNPAPMCVPYEGKILSISGQHSGRVVMPSGVTEGDAIVNVEASLDEAIANGFRHPNAILGGDQSIDTLAGAVGASKSTYRGPAITIRTAHGNHMTVSPKHPILTGMGWVTAESIRVGDNVFRNLGSGRSLDVGVESNNNNVPTTVEDEFVSLKNVGTSGLVPTAGHNFNDDRRFIEGEIDVVVTDHCLLPVPDAQIIEESGKVHFVRSDVGRVSEVSDCPESLSPVGVFAPFSIARTLAECDPVVNESSPDSGVGDVEHGGDLFASHPRIVKGDNPFNVNLLIGPGGKSCADESVAHRRFGDSQNPATVAHAIPGGIEVDEVVSVNVIDFTGHAYDFQTIEGVYSVNSIIVHNCRHVWSAYIPGTALPTIHHDPDNEGYKATQQQRYLERKVREWKRVEAAAVDDAMAREARSRVRGYQSRIRDVVAEYNLPRRRHREQLR